MSSGHVLRALALGVIAFGPSSGALGQTAPTGVRPPAAEGGSIAPAMARSASSDRDGLVFSTETSQAKPLLPAEDVAVAEQLQSLIESELARHVPRETDRTGVEAFYRGRGFAPLWVSKGKPLPRARQAIEFLKEVGADGLDSADYPTPYFNDISPHRMAVDELLLTNSVLTFARHASTGRVAFTRVSGSIYFDVKYPQATDVLTKLSKVEDIRTALHSLHPQHAAYKALKAALAAERARAGGPEAPMRIAEGSLLRPGAEDERVPTLRRRLNLPVRDGQTYDDDLVQAVRDFQEASGLQPDSIVSTSTLSRLNGESRAHRIDTVIANLERWRWLPRDLGESYVVVNVSDYTLHVVDRGTTVWSTRIVVGKPGAYATPLLTETMRFITVNPTWNVPPSIIRNEYLPALQRDPNALNRVGLRIGRNADGSLRVYQLPGSRNALGRLRFNFPNCFLVYQHGTPDKHLFEKAVRAYSHGCMRVQSPERYAEILLSISQPEQGYTTQKIESLYGPEERTIKFEKPIPVHVTYQTAFVDNTGQLQTRPDIYGHDRVITGLLRDERAVADVPVARDYHSSSKPVMAAVPQDTDFRDTFGGFRGFPFGGFRQRDRHTSNW
jgi:murein L,D-transpeptidase YcbB/YkuD